MRVLCPVAVDRPDTHLVAEVEDLMADQSYSLAQEAKHCLDLHQEELALR
jgi:hypothetical protein